MAHAPSQIKPVPDLIQIVTAALASATLRSGPHLACRPGCTQCCIGVFPISHQDAARLREGLARLTQTDFDRAPRIRTRVPASLTRLNPWLPGGRDPGDVATYGILSDSEDEQSTTLFEEFANDEPCPIDRKSTRLNSSHLGISYAVFCLKKEY